MEPVPASSVEVESDSDSESSLNEGTFASFFADFATSDADDADDMATRPAPTKEDWSEMLAAQDPYERDVRLPEFTHEVVSVAGISVKMRHGTGAALRDLGTGRVVW